MRGNACAYYVTDCVARQAGPAEVERLMANSAHQDSARSRAQGARYRLRWEQEPGSAAVREAARLVQLFAGLDAQTIRPEGDKVVRSRALAAQARAGNVYVVEGDWNEQFLREMHGFPDRPHDDIPDAASGAMNELAGVVSYAPGDGLPAAGARTLTPVPAGFTGARPGSRPGPPAGLFRPR
jgi:predicted phage terminase large subunit-like protein